MKAFRYAIFVDTAATATTCGDDGDETFVELPHLAWSKRLPFHQWNQMNTENDREEKIIELNKKIDKISIN